MSYEQRKIARQKREKKYKMFIFSIGIILFIIIISSLINKNPKTLLAVEDVFLEELELQGVVIKDEQVFKLEDAKDIDPSILEGKKIPVGIKLGNSTVANDLKLLKKELNEIESAISTLTKTNKDEVFKNDRSKLTDNYNKSIKKLQENIYTENYASTKDIKEDLFSIEEGMDDLLPQNTLLGQSVDSLNNKKEALIEEINKKDSSYISQSSGILSYNIDGYENIFKPQGFDNYTYDKLSVPDDITEKTDPIKKEVDIEGFKIIDNFQWYLALKIDDRKNIKKYEVGESLFIKYPFEEKASEISGNIIAINHNSNKSVIVLEFNKYLHDLYNDRFPKIKLIQEKLETLRIPNNVILEQDGIKGVYIKDFSGIVKFKPIEVITTVDEDTYISKGKNGIISIGDGEKELETISIYNEILLKPHRFKEGQIIN